MDAREAMERLAMADPTNFRKERIAKLLDELRYEVIRGMIEGDIDETQHFQFHVPISKSIPGGVVLCAFKTRPTPRGWAALTEIGPRLVAVK